MEPGISSFNQNVFYPPVDPTLVKVLVGFIRNETERFGIKKCVIGLSGGVDSAVAAILAQKAVGSKNLTCILLPYKTSSKDSISDALAVIKQLKVKSKVLDITPAVDSLAGFDKVDRIRKGNVIARMRMICLYDFSSKIGGLVVGTGNKTELLLGYTTLFGDSAAAINPLGDLYKTQVWQLAGLLGVPKNIIRKKPTADLWLGQTDEKEIGITYKEADRLLYFMVDLRYSDPELIKKGFKKNLIKKVRSLIRKNQFKRLPPVIAKVSNRTVNIDFRYNRDWGT